MRVVLSCNAYSETRRESRIPVDRNSIGLTVGLIRNDLICGVRTGKLCAHSHRCLQKRIQRLQFGELRPPHSEYLDDFLSRDVTNQSVLRKGTPAQSSQGRVKAPATRVIGGQNLFRRLLT